MNSPNKFLLIIISLTLSMGLFAFVQYNTNQLVTKTINQIKECDCGGKED